jgi:hypothetical protein
MATKAKKAASGRAKPRTRKLHPDQQHLPDLGPVHHPDVVAAGRELYAHRQDRLRAGKNEQAAELVLIDQMRKHGAEVYEYGGIRVSLHNSTKAKVSLVTEESGDVEAGE